jgi:hypothetical protein
MALPPTMMDEMVDDVVLYLPLGNRSLFTHLLSASVGTVSFPPPPFAVVHGTFKSLIDEILSYIGTKHALLNPLYLNLLHLSSHPQFSWLVFARLLSACHDRTLFAT